MRYYSTFYLSSSFEEQGDWFKTMLGFLYYSELGTAGLGQRSTLVGALWRFGLLVMFTQAMDTLWADYRT
jgi:hypothetical protein